MVEVLHKHEIPVGVASDDGLFGRWSEGLLILENELRVCLSVGWLQKTRLDSPKKLV